MEKALTDKESSQFAWPYPNEDSSSATEDDEYLTALGYKALQIRVSVFVWPCRVASAEG